MIVASRKPFEEIEEKVHGYKKLLVLGCGTCVSVCMAGGEKEVELLATQLRMANQLKNKDVEIGEATIQRQCDTEFIEPMVEMAKNYDAVLSMACGAGVQLVADILEPMTVTPALDTCFIGVTEAEGVWAERCRACGSCMLDKTGGICPIARCAKGLLNGPCGGSEGGKCEINPDLPCAWHLIIERLSKMGRLDELEAVIPPKDWSVSPTADLPGPC
ncbi:methylenetetrahydrofolate reductase C-terminal domain-containing protein [Chloroflexota bacterium]